jgi:hypothetical protein
MAVSILLAAPFVMSVVSDDGTMEQTPLSKFDSTWIPVSNAADLALVGSSGASSGAYPLNGKYYLTNNIILDSAVVNNHTPIGTASNPFTGTFDGRGYSISNLNMEISSATAVHAGVFGVLRQGATILNLGVVDGNIKAATTNFEIFVGGIVGWIDSQSALPVTVDNCYFVDTKVEAINTAVSSAYAGGVVGQAYGTTASLILIKNCYSIGGGITATSAGISYAGGIAGDALASIYNCSNNCDVTAYAPSSEAYAGGIIGRGTNGANISASYNEGKIYTEMAAGGIAYAGGIAGRISGFTQSTITDCYNIGSIAAKSPTTSAEAGGIVGRSDNVKLTHSYSIGSVSVSAVSYNRIGGIVGYAEGLTTIVNCHYLQGKLLMSGSSTPDVICGGGTHTATDGGVASQKSGAYTAAEMAPALVAFRGNTSIYFTGSGGWNIADIWNVDETKTINNGYPMFLHPLKTYTVTYPATGTGFTMSADYGDMSSVLSGTEITFTLTLDGGYSNPVVIINGGTLLEAGYDSITGNVYVFTITVTDDVIITATASAATLVTAAAIAGVVSPVATQAPSVTISVGTGFTSAIEWNGSPATFGYSTVYTATITLTASAGYTFSGGFANDAQIVGFTVNGIFPVWESNSGSVLKFTVAFPATGPASIVLVTAAPITGVTSPVATKAPSTAINNGTGFTSSIAWNGSPATFDSSTAYTATITLTAAAGYTFSGGFTNTAQIAGFTVNGIAPVWVSNDGSKLVFTVAFPATGAKPSTPVVPVTPVTLSITNDDSKTVEAVAGGSMTLTATLKENVSWALTGAPDGVSITNGNTLTISGSVAPGTYTITITASSGTQTATQSFVLTVTSVSAPPAEDGGIDPMIILLIVVILILLIAALVWYFLKKKQS